MTDPVIKPKEFVRTEEDRAPKEPENHLIPSSKVERETGVEYWLLPGTKSRCGKVTFTGPAVKLNPNAPCRAKVICEECIQRAGRAPTWGVEE